MSAAKRTLAAVPLPRRVAWGAPTVVIVAAVVVLGTRWLRSIHAGEHFLHTYPGTYPLPASAPMGFPIWLAVQHFLNFLLLVLIVRSGWLIRITRRPAAYWTRRQRHGTARAPQKVSFNHWIHFALNWIWIINGVVFVILLFVSGQWLRVIPSSASVFPNALSVTIQYCSLKWPHGDGWINYNALQQLAYGVTIFIAAPISALSGLRLSPLWPTQWRWASAAFPITVARRVHLPAMVYFALFLVVHVVLVLATGALRNLDHMYATRDDTSWLGLGVFLGSLVLVAIGWVVVRLLFLRRMAQLTGDVTRT